MSKQSTICKAEFTFDDQNKGSYVDVDIIQWPVDPSLEDVNHVTQLARRNSALGILLQVVGYINITLWFFNMAMERSTIFNR